jgi:hypothetical protein
MPAGTLAYAVRRRTREIGIRLAFGAHRPAMLFMILSDALKLVALGIAVGVPIAVAGGSSLRAFLCRSDARGACLPSAAPQFRCMSIYEIGWWRSRLESA